MKSKILVITLFAGLVGCGAASDAGLPDCSALGDKLSAAGNLHAEPMAGTSSGYVVYSGTQPVCVDAAGRQPTDVDPNPNPGSNPMPGTDEKK
jgi:hypothetical protein